MTLDDIALAYELAPEVLGRSLDELPPQTRTVSGPICTLMRAKRTKTKGVATSTRRWLHGACGWNFTQSRIHLERWIRAGSNRGGPLRPDGSQFVYELLIDP